MRTGVQDTGLGSDRPNPSAAVFYRALHALVFGICRVWFRVEIIGRGHIPTDGPFIVSPVHRSYIDTPLTAIICGRRLRFVGKASLWRYRLPAKILTALGGFPATGGTSARASIRNAGSLLAAGEPLVIFPEGTRRRGPIIEDLLDSPAFLSSRTNAPLIPVGIGGSARAMRHGDKVIRPTKVVVVVGKPIRPDPATHDPVSGREQRVTRRDTRKLTETLRVRLQDLFDEAQQRAGTPNSGRAD